MALELKPGDVYADHVRVLEVLGTGAFANVYKVEMAGHAQPLALKLSRHPVSATDEAQRALREIRILRSLTNPHVVRVFACGLRPDGHIYLLMDYLEGRSLDVWHDFQRPLHPAQAVTVVHQACLGLAECHARGIVHRDVKPENIFIERSGSIKVLDFGLARSYDGSPVIGTNATRVHMIIGTPHYAQPEQLKTRVLTPASDVYSLAMILYELCSARSPFHPDRDLKTVRHELIHDPVAWLAAHRDQPVFPIKEHPACHDLPPALVSALDRCLDKDPAARPPHAGVLANILGLVLHRDMGVPVAARLRLVHPDGSVHERLLLPGFYRLGRGERCELRLEDPRIHEVHAILEWSGVPTRPQLRPVAGDESVRHDGAAVQGAAELAPDDEVWIGPYRLSIGP